MTYRFKVLSVKQPRLWWIRHRGAVRVVMQIVHADPNDWMLDGIIKVYDHDPENNPNPFVVGDIRTVTL